MVGLWYWIADHHFFVNSSGYEDEDQLRMRDAKATQIWERTFWSFTYQLHGQHWAAYQRLWKFHILDPDNPQLNVRASPMRKNPYAPDRYHPGWGKMKSMRIVA